MDSSKYSNKLYLSASSLIESVIAISIIAICLLIALKVYVMIVDYRIYSNSYRVRFEVDKMVSEMKLNPDFEPQTYEFDSYRIRKSISNYKNFSNLLEVSYSIQLNTDTIVYRYLFVKNEEL